MDRLKIFSTVNTDLDKHGVDAWMEFQHPMRGRIVVKFDVTINPNKEEKAAHQADILVVQTRDIAQPDSPQFLRDIGLIALEFARRFDPDFERRKEEKRQQARAAGTRRVIRPSGARPSA